MSRSFKYTVREGDTVEDLSTRFYGVPSEYPKIVNANPSISKTELDIFPNQTLIIPERAPLNVQRNEEDSGENRVVIDIDGVRFEDVWGMTIKFSIDVAADSFSFQLPFNPDDPLLRDTFKPFQYKSIEIFIGGVLRLTGTVINTLPVTETNKKSLKVSGYSTCGVLNDCNLPTSEYPPVYKNITFFEICKIVAGAFNIEVTDNVGDNFRFAEVKIGKTDKVYSFLSKLAKKRGVLITSDVEGNLIIQRTTEDKAEFTFTEGEPNILGITANYQGQKGFTTFTGLFEAKDSLDTIGDDSAEVKDEFISDVSTPRPFVFEVDEIEEGSIEEATDAMMRRSWAERISYNLTFEGFRDPNGNLWRDNKRINIFYPGVMIYNTTEFLIKNVELIKDDAKNITKMTVVLPQSYNNEDLEGLPWLED